MIGLTLLVTGATAGEVVITGVPSYLDHYGSGPTTMGMIMGYWDAHGYDDLIPGASDWATNEQAIRDAIASPGHIEDYWPTPDRVLAEGESYHPDDSLADFMYTSRQPDTQGFTLFTLTDNGAEGYASYRGYRYWDAHISYYSSLWGFYTQAIDQGKPAQLLVDSDGDGQADRYYTGVGYDDTPGAERYAALDAVSHTVQWFDFVTVGTPNGLYGGTIVNPGPPPGDANGDYKVTDADYTIWADNFGSTAASLATGDFTGDRMVTDADYTVWADNFGTVIGPLADPVPAPAPLAVLAAAAAAILRRRR
jgi:hypothetical protein